MKKFSIGLFALLLTACGATPEEQNFDMQQIQQGLPEGCTLHFAGYVRVAESEHPSRIFYTDCKDAVTVSELHTVQQGKTTTAQNNVTVVTK